MINPTRIDVRLTFVCPVENKEMTVSGDTLSIEGVCANEEYPASHAVMIDCPCGEQHILHGSV